MRSAGVNEVRAEPRFSHVLEAAQHWDSMSAATEDLSRDDEFGQRAYDSLRDARIRMGVARLQMGAALCALKDSGGWQGRSAAKSFRRFLQEEGIEPKAAFQYMVAAGVFIVDLGLDPERIALVSTRVLVKAAAVATTGNVEEVLAVITSLPTAEALHAVAEHFELRAADTEIRSGRRIARHVGKILDQVDDLTFEDKADLYRALGLRAPASTGREPNADPETATK